MGTWVEILPEPQQKLQDDKSSPAWGRGLKFQYGRERVGGNQVVPRMGTWVEITQHGNGHGVYRGRPPHGDVG